MISTCAVKGEQGELNSPYRSFILFLTVYFRPFQLFLGAIVVVLVFSGFVWAAENKAAVRRFRRNHPSVCLVAILGSSYLLLSVLGDVAVFLFGITFPILLILIHASTRLRNLKNKLENRLESIGLKRTPMGMLLEALGQEQEFKIQDGCIADQQ
uniref:PRA1 family protein n=1 Tax=Astyanax mexicanus TaxID=7994 RepID=A0A8B9JLY4_ASTMX